LLLYNKGREKELIFPSRRFPMSGTNYKECIERSSYPGREEIGGTRG
jgi:hypothetical protein